MTAAEETRPPGPPPGAIVLGADYAALAVVRSLGRRGVPVWVLYDDHRLAATSRYAERRLRWPRGEQARLALLHALADREGAAGWALVPTGEEATYLLAAHHEQLSRRFVVTTPPWDVMRWGLDKRLTYSLARRVDVPAPWTVHPSSREELRSMALKFPAILKPAVKVPPNELTDDKAWRVDDVDELAARFDEATEVMPPETTMVQELIEQDGRRLSFGALCVEGRPILSITVHETRQLPLDFGRSSSFVETVDEPEVEPLARRVLEEIGLTGLVEVEFKQDPRDGKTKLLDINPRVWGWHSLGARAGTDFSWALWQLHSGRPVAPARAAIGVRWARAVTDVPAAWLSIRRGTLSPRAYLASLRGPLEPAVAALDDPLPAIAELPLLVRLWLVRRLRRRRRARAGQAQ